MGPFLNLDGKLRDAALSPDGRSVAIVSFAERSGSAAQPGRLEFWDPRAGIRLSPTLPMPSDPRVVAYSPDGTRVAVVCQGGQAVVVDTANRSIKLAINICIILTYEKNLTLPSLMTVSASSPLVGLQARVWDVLTGKLRTHPMRHDGWVFGLAVSHDGRLSRPGLPTTSAPVGPLHRAAARTFDAPDWVFKVSFSPDDRLVLTGCRDHMARLWDWQDRKPICPPFKHDDEVFGVAFIPDGRDGHFVLTATRDATARAWEWHTGKPVTPPLRLDGRGFGIATTTAVGMSGRRHVGQHRRHRRRPPRGRGSRLVTECSRASLGDLTEPCDLSLDDLRLICEIVSGFRVYKADIEGLTTEGWLERWEDFRQRHPRDVEMATSSDFSGIASWLSGSRQRGDGAKP